MALSILTKLLLLLPLVHLVTPLPLERRCSAETLQFPDAETISYIPAGTNLSLPFNDPSCNRPNQVVPVDICRVTLYTATSCRSGVYYEVWLPLEWKGRRFLGTGNGGIDGCEFTSIWGYFIQGKYMPRGFTAILTTYLGIKYEDLAYGVKNGFAVVGSNNGHNGTTAVTMYHNYDVQIDFSWRAKSYYIGCSLGGRQGFQSAVKFPEDFDGIVAGAPGLDFNNLVSWRAGFFPLTGSVESPDFITAKAWKTFIHREVLRQCDGIDGVMDGIIEDPSLCHFNADALLCKSGEETDCLSQVQVDIVRKIFSPLMGEDGGLIYPAMQPGSEELATTKLYAGKPFSYSDEWFKYVIYNPSWNASTFTIHDAAVAEARNPGGIKTWPTFYDLAEYRERNGKIIVYHGGQDNQITSFNTERYYNYLLQSDGAGSARHLDRFLRIFRISGMFHCSGGPGAWVLGQGGGATSEGIEFKGETNVLAALVDWVEKDVAPDTIEGVKFVDDEITSGVSLCRRHCRLVFSHLLPLRVYTDRW
ncbi:feruloyl esterase, putative [Trichophyton benhamiae CBS 112371]|uniref:Carboxylic ester hydrolase n=1 Tax=Arthroderma benhamiae (strain ATCC MYA-4681 / CBS 112371) TaxID=663331 RepID=D4B119_ARTBC|nr:feruloyl esterase, putative [Trichophyton benhamiae CBS 112371]EFE30954.1 feruloyl esterase, putative [Trichophyton benhamiae CBS 112371]